MTIRKIIKKNNYVFLIILIIIIIINKLKEVSKFGDEIKLIDDERLKL